MGLNPPWISKTYGFQRVFGSRWLLSPPPFIKFVYMSWASIHVNNPQINLKIRCLQFKKECKFIIFFGLPLASVKFQSINMSPLIVLQQKPWYVLAANNYIINYIVIFTFCQSYFIQILHYVPKKLHTTIFLKYPLG